jgi:Flp pilus assembly protein TadD
VTADHGESLGDHGETTHGLFAYDATLRVPLIVTAPGLQPNVVSTPASHIDIFPTILDFVGESPDDTEGRSLRRDIEGSGSTGAPIYFEALDASLTRGWAPLKGVVSEGWKYIDLPEPELYHLDVDPDERTNLVARESARVAALQGLLAKWPTAAAALSRSVVDSTTAARLRSLGYLSSSGTSRAVYTPADDPKRLVALSELFNDALDDFGRGRREDALAKLSKILTARPDFLAARLSAATALISSNRPADAVRLLRGASSNDQEPAQWQMKMGQALAAAGDLEGARTVLESAVKASGGDSEPLNDFGVVLLRLGQRDEARRKFEQLLELDPTATGTWYNLGLLEMEAQRSTAAAAAFGRVVELDPRHADGWRGLGAAVAAHDTARAVAAWQRVMELDPQDFDTLFNLGMTLADAGRRNEAALYLRRFLAEAPRDRYAKDFPRVRAKLARLDKPS